jgi:hypothetical protein
MDNREFLETALRLAVCPSEHKWPRPEVSITRDGDGNGFIAAGLHWQRAHDAAAGLRDLATRAINDVTAVNADKSLSPEGKRAKKRQLAKWAKVALEQSKITAHARETFERQLAKWDDELNRKLSLATTAHAATVYQELWKQSREKKGAERLAWLNQYAADETFASALLTSPLAVTGLSADEMKFLRSKFEAAVAPAVAAQRSLTARALDEIDAGTRNALTRICEAAGLPADLIETAQADAAAWVLCRCCWEVWPHLLLAQGLAPRWSWPASISGAVSLRIC